MDDDNVRPFMRPAARNSVEPHLYEDDDDDLFDDAYDGEAFHENPPFDPTVHVRATITIEGYYDKDQPFDEDHCRLFFFQTVKGQFCGGEMAVDVSWPDELPF